MNGKELRMWLCLRLPTAIAAQSEELFRRIDSSVDRTRFKLYQANLLQFVDKSHNVLSSVVLCLSQVGGRGLQSSLHFTQLWAAMTHYLIKIALKYLKSDVSRYQKNAGGGATIELDSER